MAPDTSGIRSLDQARSEALFERALEIAIAVLAPGGNFVGKLFQGPDFKKLTEAVRARFEIAKTAKPASSRQISIEQYVIGKGFAADERAAAPRDRAVGRADRRARSQQAVDILHAAASPPTRPIRSTRSAARSSRATRSSGSTARRA